jgi:hypothetical protein
MPEVAWDGGKEARLWMVPRLNGVEGCRRSLRYS